MPYLPVNLSVREQLHYLHFTTAIIPLLLCFYTYTGADIVSTVTRLRTGRLEIGVRIPAEEKIALFSTAFSPALERSQPPNECMPSWFHFTLFEWKWKSLLQ
jgi:hypothetical protein